MPGLTNHAVALFPASPPKNSKRLSLAKHCLERKWPEFQVEWPRKVGSREAGNNLDYLAGSDEERCQELLSFLNAPDQEVGWFGRGGYGVTRLLRSLDEGLQSASPAADKRWMGYSDITALFSFVKARGFAIQCIHGPMICAFAEQPNSGELRKALSGEPVAIPVSKPAAELSFSGSIWGGNLAVLASLCGTPWLARPGAEQAILLEDVDEAPYRLDRFLTQLADGGFFSLTQKIFLGTFTGFKPEADCYQLVEERCRELGLQVLGHLPIGHSEPHSPLFLDHHYEYCSQRGALVPHTNFGE